MPHWAKTTWRAWWCLSFFSLRPFFSFPTWNPSSSLQIFKSSVPVSFRALCTFACGVYAWSLWLEGGKELLCLGILRCSLDSFVSLTESMGFLDSFRISLLAQTEHWTLAAPALTHLFPGRVQGLLPPVSPFLRPSIAGFCPGVECVVGDTFNNWKEPREWWLLGWDYKGY